ncbi:hypothetical protein Tco_0033075, partial [Tanacetum coccineum]
DLIFFGDNDDEGSAAANSVMHALTDGDRGLEGIGSSVGTVGGLTGARCSSSSSYGQQDSSSGSSLSSSRIGVSNVAWRSLLLVVIVITTGSVVVPPSSVVVPLGSVVVPPGSVVVTTGSVVVPPGSGRQNRGQGNNAPRRWSEVRLGCAGSLIEQWLGTDKPGQARQVKCYNCRYGIGAMSKELHLNRQAFTELREYFKDKMVAVQVKRTGSGFLALNVDSSCFKL